MTVSNSNLDIIERDVDYIGPYIVDFIGDLAGTNVAQMSANDTYTVTTDWNGGANNGQNEKQLIEVNSFGGTFALRVFNIGAAAAPFIKAYFEEQGVPEI